MGSRPRLLSCAAEIVFKKDVCRCACVGKEPSLRCPAGVMAAAQTGQRHVGPMVSPFGSATRHRCACERTAVADAAGTFFGKVAARRAAARDVRADGMPQLTADIHGRSRRGRPIKSAGVYLVAASALTTSWTGMRSAAWACSESSALPFRQPTGRACMALPHRQSTCPHLHACMP